jgi:integrase/recombinase XerC
MSAHLPEKGVRCDALINGPAPLPRPGPGNGGISSDAPPILFTAAEVARLWRDAMKDKSYRAFPMGLDAGHYLRAKRKRLTTESYRDYEACLDKLARYFADLKLTDLEPPIGTERLEEFLEFQWGSKAERTYNKNLSILHDFFLFHVRRGNLRGDPTLIIERAKTRAVLRTTFTPDDRGAILASNPELRDGLALRLLLDYGLRKGALQNVQFKHFDHYRKRLTVFTKGGKIRELPIPHTSFWFDLERLIVEEEAQSNEYLLPRQKAIPRKHGMVMHRFRYKPMGVHGLHNWWYRCLQRAGIVPSGVTSGERMHKARHTAGQRLLDATGNLKAVQKLLGHESIQTTGDIYTDWDVEQLAESLIKAVDYD